MTDPAAPEPEAATPFDYEVAFNRNRGFVSRQDQSILRRSRVGIAGLGGTGGYQVNAFARLGIGRFNLADPDTFELINFNRQLLARTTTIGRSKTEVAREEVAGINPDADVRLFADGISPENIDTFLDDLDVVVDSLDFYCFSERFLLYRAARERGLWVVTAPPLGFGYTLLVFDPKGMTFEDYFAFHPNDPQRELIVSLVAGIAPRPYMLKYMDFSEVALNDGQLPSVGAARLLIAGVVTTEVFNILLRKRPQVSVPTVYQFDALLKQYQRRRYPWGMRGPIQRVKKAILRRRLPF